MQATTKLEADLHRDGLSPGIRTSTDSNVHQTRISFPGLPFQMGATSDHRKTMMIKIEVDSNPPAGAGIRSSRVARDGLDFTVRHHDLPSMLAGKIHALPSRTYTKGRDFYDLAWYLKRETQPNITFLNAALAQSGWTGPRVTASNWRPLVLERVRSADWTLVREDVDRFVRPADAIFAALSLTSLARSLSPDRER